MSTSGPTIKLAEYLFTRLHQLGIRSIHGVPGDYNLSLLDYVEPQGLHWVGNCNELNAGYATDAYSRVVGLGALITTFGVGELSAVNAIAGAYAELAPVVHIVGTPGRPSQESRARVHHTLNDGNYIRFAEMYKQITVAQANLVDPRTAPERIDATIQECLIQSRPVYIQLPVDMVDATVCAERLQSKIAMPSAVPSQDEAVALKLILDRMYASERPVILVDGESRAYGILALLGSLVQKTKWPTWTSAFGKSCIEESIPNVYGVWNGTWGSSSHDNYIRSSDLVLCFGPHFTNTNTSIFTTIPNPDVSILFDAKSVTVKGQVFRDLPSKNFVSSLLSSIDATKLLVREIDFVEDGTHNTPESPMVLPPEGPITQKHFYKAFSSHLRTGDMILAETGTAGHGCRQFKLPPGCQLFAPATWLSIGYMLPAAQGAALAQRELHDQGERRYASTGQVPRTVLFIGDGSFQMTVQEVSTMIREKLNVLIILINNDGYTIERCLHGYKEAYNDVASWRYLQAPEFFGGVKTLNSDYGYKTSRASTWSELQSILEEEDRQKTPRFSMIEVIMEREDAPESLLFYLNQQKEAAV